MFKFKWLTVNGSMFKWKPAMSGSLLGLVLFSIFINNIDIKLQCTLTNFAGNTKLSGAVIPLEQRDVLINKGRQVLSNLT